MSLVGVQFDGKQPVDDDARLPVQSAQPKLYL